VWGAGLVPIVAGLSAPWKAFGLGLLFPGAGFLYTSDLILFALVVLALPYVAVIRFQFRADHVTPVLFTVGAAAGASLRTHTGLWEGALWAVPTTLAVMVLAVRVGRRVAFVRATARREARNTVVAEAQPRRAAADWPPHVPEHDEEDLAVLDWFLDRALQPLEQWDGFDWAREQYSMAAMRYQLNWMQWTLALANYTRTPAFGGYLTQGQANLIERMTERRVWQYWHRENAWGNLDLNPDPIVRDNIMLSGYLGVMLATFALVTGDRRFDEDGALRFRWDDDKTFAYSGPDVLDAIERQFAATPWGFFPCEPSLNFAGCNAIGLLGLAVWDRAQGTDRAAPLLEPFRRTLDEEFTTVDGDITTIISQRWGYGMRFVRSPVVQAGTAYFLRPLLPDVADRTWAVVRHESFERDGSDGLRPHRLSRYDTDLGNNERSPATRFAFYWGLAAEMGDEQIVERVRAAAAEKLDLRTVDGVASYARCSAYANATLGLSRFARPDAWLDLARRGMPEPWRTGPRLAAAPYPEVRVARAVTDGHALDLVLQPGRGGAGRRPLVLDRLVPHATYDVRGGVVTDVQADAEGSAYLDVELDGRTEMTVTPRR
jgi:hypothetical protein